jgi:hypothetical protein
MLHGTSAAFRDELVFLSALSTAVTAVLAVVKSGARSARLNSAAELKRSAGNFSSALSTAALTFAGTDLR